MPTLGSARARLLVVGLAPGRMGANRTGKVFVGDDSGRALRAALTRTGIIAPGNAGLVRFTNIVRCLPPQNRPTGIEIRNCADYLRRDLGLLARRGRRHGPVAILALGRSAHEAVGRALGVRIAEHRFEHGTFLDCTGGVGWFSSYHPSRYNLNTRRVTEAMLDATLFSVRNWLDGRGGEGS